MPTAPPGYPDASWPVGGGCGSRAVPTVTPWLSPQPSAGACAPNLRALDVLWGICRFFPPEATSGGERWGCPSSKATASPPAFIILQPGKIQLLLATINSPIILAIDLIDFISTVHWQQLPLSTLMIIWKRIPVKQCSVSALGENEFTVINAFTTDNWGMHDWSPLRGACPLQVTFNWISKWILPDDSGKFTSVMSLVMGHILWLNIY